jgi:hypothetical protein
MMNGDISSFIDRHHFHRRRRRYLRHGRVLFTGTAEKRSEGLQYCVKKTKCRLSQDIDMIVDIANNAERTAFWHSRKWNSAIHF